MSPRRLLFLGALLPVILGIACGDTFRPVFIPLPNNPPDPKLQSHVVTVSTNGVADFGRTSLIDVSGDSNQGNTVIGKAPIFAALEPNGRLFVANAGNDTLSVYLATTLLVTTMPPLPSTIVLPPGSNPTFLVSTLSGAMYVANAGTNTVGQISDLNVLIQQAATGSNPVALAETPDGSKLYAVNHNDGTVTSINTINFSYSPLSPITVGNAPQWAVTSSDGRSLFVANQGSDSITVIDTFTDTVRGTLTLDAGAAPNFILFDRKRTRLYVCEPGAGKVSVWDASVQAPALPTLIATVTVDPNPMVIALLPDGSKFYAVSYQASGAVPPATVSSVVSVKSVDAVTFRVLASIPITADVQPVGSPPVTVPSGLRFPVYSVPSLDSSRVYVTWYEAGGTAIIRTSDDSFVLNLQAPGSSQNGVPPPPQNPVFLVTAPL